VLLLYRLVPSNGSNKTMHISNFSATDLARGSSGIRVSPTSLFFFGLPLL
jgi:hypothetical protein